MLARVYQQDRAFQSPFGDFLICKIIPSDFDIIEVEIKVSVPIWGLFNL